MPHLTQANRTRPNSVEKQRKALLFDQRMESCELALWSPHFLTGLPGLPSTRRGRGSHRTEWGCRRGAPRPDGGARRIISAQGPRVPVPGAIIRS